MDIMKTKKYIMAAAAVWILFFHLWIPVFPYGSIPGQAERFILGIAYIGVDMFFFVSAYSLAKRPVTNYGKFVLNRALKLLPLFILAYLTGSFLWFLPALMAVYLLLPPMLKLIKSDPWFYLSLFITIWLVLVMALPGLGIFLYRLPSVFLGAYYGSKRKLYPKRTEYFAGTVLLLAGILLCIKLGYMHKLNFPTQEAFYLTGLPLMMGIIMLIDAACAGREFKVLGFLGEISLELYFVQVVLGPGMIDLLFKLTNMRLLTNIASFSLSILIAFSINLLSNLLPKERT